MYIIIIIGSRALYCITVLQNRLAKTEKASLKKRSIMEYSPGLLHDNKSLRNCSGNRVKMILKCILESNALQIYQGHQTLSAQFRQSLMDLSATSPIVDSVLFCVCWIRLRETYKSPLWCTVCASWRLGRSSIFLSTPLLQHLTVPQEFYASLNSSVK